LGAISARPHSTRGCRKHRPGRSLFAVLYISFSNYLLPKISINQIHLQTLCAHLSLSQPIIFVYFPSFTLQRMNAMYKKTPQPQWRGPKVRQARRDFQGREAGSSQGLIVIVIVIGIVIIKGIIGSQGIGSSQGL
jgi:hypothetical protein